MKKNITKNTNKAPIVNETAITEVMEATAEAKATKVARNLDELKTIQNETFQAFGGLINARQAYFAAALIEKGEKPMEADQKHYDALVSATEQAVDYLPRIGASALFNLLDGRKTGRKIASSLGSSLNIRTWLAHLGYTDGATTTSTRKSKSGNEYTARTTSFVKGQQPDAV